MEHLLLGAIAGDVIGSLYEFHPTKDYSFTLLHSRMMDYTDDSIMTIAVADWLLHGQPFTLPSLADTLRLWGNRYRYPHGGYGGIFTAWLSRKEMGPYNSWGNGSAMRVSSVGYAFDTLEETQRVARLSAEVTHNHPEGIKGAQATAAAIFLARTGASKEEIKDFITREYGYDLDRDYKDIHATYRFEPSCQETVPQSIIAFLVSNDYEDALRLTISLGGDADTMGAITGAIAYAYYKEMPPAIHDFAWNKLPDDMKDIVTAFDGMCG